MIEIQHERDRKRFRQNFQIARQTEEIMRRQRKDLGLPEQPKGSKRWNVSVFRPHQPRD